MKLDIVFVTFNSEKWIDNCLKSILNSDYDLSNISLLFCDNHSTDNTLKILSNYKDNYENKFNQFEIVESMSNLGFGRGNNKAAKLGNSEYILFLNIDTEVDQDTFKKLSEELDKCDQNIGAWELRQKPYEHPKYYDPITGITSWASGACLVIKREIFEKIHGFDPLIFMYAEDVEISWNIRKRGYKIKYLPHVSITHYSYKNPNEFKKTQYIYSLINNLYLRYKYGNIKNMIKGNLLVIKRCLKNYLSPIVSVEEDKEIRKIIFKEYIKVQFKGIVAVMKNIFSHRSSAFKPKFILGFDYEKSKLDPFYNVNDLVNDGPLVSIIVRTCNRPKVLREALISIRNQYYKNIEIIVVEDGPEMAKKMIENEFSDLNIHYYCMGTNQGRSVAGNLGLEKANGEYLNFLDDDDLFYPDHVSVLVKELLEQKSMIAYTTAFEAATDVYSRDPYRYSVKNVDVVHSGKFSRMKLFSKNITPIQAVMFHKDVYKKCGGFDTTIDALEDWDLWLRFALEYDWKYIEKTTSLYRVPCKRVDNLARDQFLVSTLDYVVNKYSNKEIKMTVKDIYNLKNGY